MDDRREKKKGKSGISEAQEESDILFLDLKIGGQGGGGAGWEQVQGLESRSKELRVPGHQLTRKHEPQSYSQKGLDCTNNQNDLEAPFLEPPDKNAP